MAEELEYHVTFPTKFRNAGSPRGAEAAAAIADDEVELTERTPEKEPVIFLLGWYNADDKELAKYSAIYMSEGYVTIRYVLPGEYLFDGKLGGVRDIAMKVLEAFFDLGLEENPIFFHLFSNGGGYIYRAVTEILNGRDPGQFAALRIGGVVFDSTPCRPTFGSGFRAMALFSPSSASRSWPVSYLMTAPYWGWTLMKHVVFPSYWEAKRLMNSYIQAIAEDKMECPQLFVYSKKDCITSYADIREVVERRRERGVDVREAYWEDGDHLAHLANHHKEYVTACLELVLTGLQHLDDSSNQYN